MDRRSLLSSGLAAGAVLTSGSALAQSPGKRRFKLKYAPHFGMFKENAGDDLIDQLQFMADQGFTAMEDNGMMGRPVDVQEKIARKMAQLGMTMGLSDRQCHRESQVVRRRVRTIRACHGARIAQSLDESSGAEGADHR